MTWNLIIIHQKIAVSTAGSPFNISFRQISCAKAAREDKINQHAHWIEEEKKLFFRLIQVSFLLRRRFANTAEWNN